MVVELQIDFTDIFLFVFEKGQLVGSVGHLGYLEEGSPQLLLLALLFYAESSLELFFLGVYLHREGLIPSQLSLLNEELSGLELLLIDL